MSDDGGRPTDDGELRSSVGQALVRLGHGERWCVRCGESALGESEACFRCGGQEFVAATAVLTAEEFYLCQ